jgi:transcriptional regulator with XRE-family HTH domain
MTADTMAKRFSPDKLRRLRLAKGWSEARLGVEAGCSDEQVKNLEKPRTDRTKGPHADLLSALADALGVKMERLFED